MLHKVGQSLVVYFDTIQNMA